MSVTQALSKFAQLVSAHLTGDTDQVIILKNERKAKSAIEGQISALNRSIIDAEDALSDKEEAYNKVFAPATTLPDSQTYIRQVQTADEAVEAAQDRLDDLKADLARWEARLQEFEPGTATGTATA